MRREDGDFAKATPPRDRRFDDIAFARLPLEGIAFESTALDGEGVCDMGIGAQDGEGAITRREFVAGAAAAGAVAIAGAASASIAGCGSDSTTTDFTPLSPTSSDISTVAESYSESSQDEHVANTTEFTLPAGALVWCDSDDHVAVLMPGETSSPLTYGGVMDLSTGTYTTLLSQAESASEGYSITDLRASDNLLMWVETNFTTGAWRVYSAPLTFSASVPSVGAATLLEEASEDYEAALIAVSGSTAVWVTQPSESGSKTSDNTYVRSQASGGQSATICTSPGRLATQPRITNGTLCITPRMQSSSVYYKLLACNPQNGGEIASAVLPTPIKPLDAVWTGSAFAFSVEATYDSSPIGAYGVYLMQGQRYLRLAGIPIDGPMVVGSNLVCKVGTRMTVLATDAQQYYTISLPSGCASYGDCYATTGCGSRLVAYTTVSERTDESDAVVSLRVMELG